MKLQILHNNHESWWLKITNFTLWRNVYLPMKEMIYHSNKAQTNISSICFSFAIRKSFCCKLHLVQNIISTFSSNQNYVCNSNISIWFVCEFSAQSICRLFHLVNVIELKDAIISNFRITWECKVVCLVSPRTNNWNQISNLIKHINWCSINFVWYKHCQLSLFY